MERILKTFMVRPDFPWKRLRPTNRTNFRHADSGKWFALVSERQEKVLDRTTTKNRRHRQRQNRFEASEEIRKHPNIYPAYHMNHKT